MRCNPLMTPKLGFSLGILILVAFAIFYQTNNQTVEPKDFADGSYYQGYNSDESPDYKRIYSEQSAGIPGIEACTRDAVPISTNFSAYRPSSELGFLWFWAVPSASTDDLDKLMSSGQDVGEGRTLFKVPKGTELVAIADSTLVPQSQYPQGMYPSSDYTKGVHLTYDIKLIDKEIAYRITYMSMEKWWLCADKKEPDTLVNNDEAKPRYIIGETVGAKELYSSTVVGYSGYTGVPSTMLLENDSFLTVKVEKAEVDDTGLVTSAWEESSISELYAGGS